MLVVGPGDLEFLQITIEERLCLLSFGRREGLTGHMQDLFEVLLLALIKVLLFGGTCRMLRGARRRQHKLLAAALFVDSADHV